jgi:hypothetical protein
VTTGPAGSAGSSADPDAAAWIEYLDALESAVHALDGDIVDGHAPDASRLADLAPPATPMPPRLADRRTLLLALLQDVTGRAQAHRDAVASELLSLPHRRTPTGRNAPATLGGMLDIVG